jgi:hypothetical protein
MSFPVAPDRGKFLSEGCRRIGKSGQLQERGVTAKVGAYYSHTYFQLSNTNLYLSKGPFTVFDQRSDESFFFRIQTETYRPIISLHNPHVLIIQ